MAQNSSMLLKLILAGVVLTLIVALANYLNWSKTASSGDLAAGIEQAITSGQAMAYGINECAKPVVPGTSMTDTQLRFYLNYHLIYSNFTSGAPNFTPTWYTCLVYPYFDRVMQQQSHASLMNMVTTMESATNRNGGCDVPNVSDAPAKVCGRTRPL